MLRLAALFVLLALPLRAQDIDAVVTAELRPGWRLADGAHMAALHLTLAPGWKTYWRAPGDAGIPPVFDWQGQWGNLRGVTVEWPTPGVFWQSGMRSVGYADSVVLPLRVDTRDSARDVRLSGLVDLGVCREVCIPHRVRVTAVLPAAGAGPDPMIAAALANRPLTAAEAGVGAVRCSVAPMEGGLRLRAEVEMPRPGGPVATVIETADPRVWVAEPDSAWSEGGLIADTRLRHVRGGVFALDRSGVRITVLRPGEAVDIVGCAR